MISVESHRWSHELSSLKSTSLKSHGTMSPILHQLCTMTNKVTHFSTIISPEGCRSDNSDSAPLQRILLTMCFLGRLPRQTVQRKNIVSTCYRYKYACSLLCMIACPHFGLCCRRIWTIYLPGYGSYIGGSLLYSFEFTINDG